MEGRSVFECEHCFYRYDQGERMPLSLPCGHVFCRSCLRGMAAGERIRCPADKLVHAVTVEKLPCCLPLLAGLPKPVAAALAHNPSPTARKASVLQYAHCSKHPKKRIRFHCKDHFAYLCSVCIIEHTGEGHQVVVFEVTIEEMRREAEAVYAMAQKVIAEVRDAEVGKGTWERRVNAYFQTQLLKISTVFDSAIQKLNQKKAELLDTLKRFHKNQLMVLELKYKKTLTRLDSAQSLLEEVQRLVCDVENQSYDEFLRSVGEKKGRIRAMETQSEKMSECSLYAFREGAILGDLGSIEETTPDQVFEGDFWTSHTAPVTPLTRPYDASSSSPQSGTLVEKRYDDEHWKCKDCNSFNSSASLTCPKCRTVKRGEEGGTQTVRKMSDSSSRSSGK